MSLSSVIFINNLPTLDIHGYDRQTARVAINDFIKDNLKLKQNIIVIIHGIGSGILKNETFEALKENKMILEYKLYPYNNGCTIAQIKI